MVAKILSILDKPGTWRLVVYAVSAFGVTLAPEEAEKIILAGVSMAEVVSLFVKKLADKKATA
jgi:hypothetical protein